MTGPEEQKQGILRALLSVAPFEGWTESALAEASRITTSDRRMGKIAFPGGIMEAADYWCEASLKLLKKDDVSAFKMRERIEILVMALLAEVTPHREALRRLLVTYFLPQHMGRGLKALSRIADEIWYLAGDRSADFSYYTKRVSLTGVLVSTGLFWLQSSSGSLEETRAFLSRRIGDIMTVGKWRKTILKPWPLALS